MGVTDLQAVLPERSQAAVVGLLVDQLRPARTKGAQSLPALYLMHCSECRAKKKLVVFRKQSCAVL